MTVFARFSISILLLLLVLFSVAVPAYATTTTDPPSIFDSALEWAKGVFVPDKDYFPNQFQKLNSLVSEKLGGIGFLFKSLEHLFVGLGQNSSATAMVFTLPDNYFFRGFKGFSVDMLSHGAVYVKLLRDVFSVFMCVITSIACYKRLVALFDT